MVVRTDVGSALMLSGSGRERGVSVPDASLISGSLARKDVTIVIRYRSDRASANKQADHFEGGRHLRGVVRPERDVLHVAALQDHGAPDARPSHFCHAAVTSLCV